MPSNTATQIAFLILLSMQASNAAIYNSIALSGPTGSSQGLGPGLGAGIHFDLFDEPVLNSKGQVAFSGILSGSGIDATNNRGLWSNTSGSLQVVARTGNGGHGPGVGSGVEFSLLGYLVLNNSGETAFLGMLTGTGVDSSNNLGIWTNRGGLPEVVARSGSEGPGPNVGAGIFFSGFSYPLFNDAGELAFQSTLTGSNVDNSNNEGVWLNDAESLSVAARSGADGPGPGVEPGVYFEDISIPRMNASGDIVFNGSLAGADITGSNSQGIWTWVDGGLQLIARAGSTGPGPELGASVNFSAVSAPRINNSGDVAFLGFLTGAGVSSSNNRGVWSSRAGGVLQAIARTGTNDLGPGVGTGVTFSLLNGVLLNAKGDVTFRGTLKGTGIDSSNNSGIWLHEDGMLRAIARSGENGPGPGLGADSHFSSFPYHAINASGDVAFVASLAGATIDATNDTGLWVSVDGSIINVARTGEVFDVDPTANVDLRTISEVEFGTGAGGEDGRGQTFNDQGLLVFQLGFTDGSSGIFTAQLPAVTSGDFDLDGDVDGRDFLLWQRSGSPDPLSEGDLADWRANYGVGSLIVKSTAAEAASSVPEPATWMLQMLGGFAVLIIDPCHRTWRRVQYASF